MTINEKIKELEEESIRNDWSNEDFLCLLRTYIEDGSKDYLTAEKKENARITCLALERMILNRMK